MMEKFTSNIARQMGMELSGISLVNGCSMGCKDTYLLNMFTQGYTTCSILYQTDIRDLENGFCCDRLEVTIRSALSRLKTTLEQL
jgi:hypothetical protein